MPKWLVLSSILSASAAGSPEGECASGETEKGAQSSAMLQMRSGKVAQLNLGQSTADQSDGQFKDMYDSAVALLKDGATPEVMALSKKTIADIESSVLPAVKSAHATDEKLFESTLARFTSIAAEYKKKVEELAGSHKEQDAISKKHVGCRGEEKKKCDAARRCEKERLELWEVYVQKNETYNGDAEGLCDIDSQSMKVREKRYEAAAASGTERFAAWREHEKKRKECEQKSADQAAKATQCNLFKAQLEQLGCDQHALHLSLQDEVASEYALALKAYNTVRSAVEKEQSDRHREVKTLTEVKCLMDKIYERSGKPCSEQEVKNGVVDKVEEACRKKGEGVDLKPLTIKFTDPPASPEAPKERPYPCQSDFIAEHYGSFMDDACFDDMPQCQRCGGLTCPEPNVVFEGKCFYVHEERKQFNYEQAKQFCADTGGQIASIHSKEENTAVLGLVKDTPRSSYIGATRMCSGPKDCTPWKWDDGSEWVEPNWPTDRLNSNGGTWKNGETHIVIHKDGKWHDWERGQVMRDVLCQFGRQPVVKNCPPPNTIVDDKCYFVHEEAKSLQYDAAKKYCTDSGGIIASIHTNADNNAALKLVHGRSSYIGATRACKNEKDCGPWSWEDGSEWVKPTWPTDGLNSNGGTWRKGDLRGETHIVIHTDKKWHDWQQGNIVKDVLCQQTDCFVAEDIDYRGEDIPGAQVKNVESAKDCLELCNRHPECKAYAYAKKTGICYLKDGVPKPLKNDCCDSGLACRV